MDGTDPAVADGDKVLVGLNGSPESASALRWANRFALRTDARIVAVHAVVPGSGEARVTPVELESDVHEWIEAAALGAHVPIDVGVHVGDPRQVLPEVIVAERPVAAVLGRGADHLGLGPDHPGRVAGYTAWNSEAPVVLVPVGTRHPYPRIVVGVDGSAGSRRAVEWCVRYAGALDATVIAVGVAEEDPEGDPWYHGSGDRAGAEAALVAQTDDLRDLSIPVETTTLLHQHPATGLLHVARSRQADLLVVGTRGAGGFDGLRMGGTALRLLRHTEIPVVVVPLERVPVG